MRVTRSLWTLVGLLSSMIQPAIAGPPFPLKASLQFDEKSPYATVIFESEPQEKVPSWNVELLSFEPDTHKWTYGPLKGWGTFSPVLPEGTRQFHAALVKPGGTYAINNLSSQGWWHACFNSGTKAFPVEAGKITGKICQKY